MRGVDATRHQTVSTWTIELMTVLAVTIGLTQYLFSVLALGTLSTLSLLLVFGVGFALLRIYLSLKMFGGIA